MARLTERAWQSSPDELMAMAQRLQDAYLRVKDTLRRRDQSPNAWAEWEAATEAFHRTYREFYEDGEPDTHAADVRAGDPAATERAVRFLERDAQCFRSGYAKERLLRALRAAQLSPPQIERLRGAMMHAVDAGGHRELGEWCRLARRLDVRTVETLLSQRFGSDDPDVQRRARWAKQRLVS